mmetsp:Transcript_15835/g.43698  ORF Transcript_15835/g.43698 Transcript_15835/m.43698 type:complete len:486 (-) Transcript_15835:94-1551(-)|eukprot:CAMPEP_0198119044 /NCGR_PEP_ID=MMETSP1442-20131203/24070_1 /TAXON_ID= /ORGANISM="Craspedostauros australis, Strain CCMP3328" /LENGTH=485 /DNA_ID=CAMNT_0043777425 /DNA_START=173 /DNA_END=1630 /DNA_ORIENTATION=+
MGGQYHDEVIEGDSEERFRDEEELEMPVVGRSATHNASDDEEVEGFIEESMPSETRSRKARRKAARHASCTAIFLSFLVGALLGGAVVGSIMHYSTVDSTPSTGNELIQADCSNDSSVDGSVDGSVDDSKGPSKDADDLDDADESKVVSYAFLQTHKGKKVLKELMDMVTHDRSPRRALKKALEYMKNDHQIDSSCHPLIHVVGRHTLTLYGFEGAVKELRDKEPLLLRTCNAAFMHGVIENYLAMAGQPQHQDDGADAPTEPVLSFKDSIEHVESTLCHHIDDSVVPQGTWECGHGVGHGILQNIRNRHIRAALVEAVDVCNNSTVLQASVCENGLWMDHFASTPVASDLNTDTFLDACDLAHQGHSSTCYIYAPTEYLLHFPKDYQGAMEACETNLNRRSKTRYLDSCTGGVGMQALKENLGDFELAEKVCSYASRSAQRNHCMSYSMSFQRMATGEAYSKSKCEVIQDEQFKKICQSGTNLP